MRRGVKCIKFVVPDLCYYLLAALENVTPNKKQLTDSTNYLKYVFDTQEVFTRVFGRRKINLWHDKSLNNERETLDADNEATNTQAEQYDRSLKSS